jgi:hypothetical protein
MPPSPRSSTTAPASAKPAGILWSGVQRDGVTLAECGEEVMGGAVKALATKLLLKKPR